MENSKPPFQAVLSEDRTEVTIDIAGTQVQANAEELENALAHLGMIRSNMIPAVAKQIDNAPGVMPLSNIQFDHIGPNKAPTEMGAVLVVASAYFGWFHYQLEPSTCKKLASWLTTGGPKIELN